LASRRVRFLAGYTLDTCSAIGRLRRGGYELFHPTFYDDYFLPWLGGRPYVITLYDCTPEMFPNLFQGQGLYGRLVTGRWVKNRKPLFDRAARVIAISHNTKADAIRLFGIEPNKIDVVHLGASGFPPSSATDSSPVEGPYVAFVGSRWGYKNFPALAHALRPLLVQDRTLRVLCAGGGPFSVEEQNLFRSLDCGDRFIQKDFEDDDLAQCYRNATAFIFPSLYEGFGLPIVEAFSVGCPCIVSRASCFPEIAGDAAEYFDPADIPSMTEAIGRVIHDPQRRQELVNLGKARAQLYSWDTTAAQTFEVYRRALGS
jgi:glycosyltransferase involved in cell wall biosynthesis